MSSPLIVVTPQPSIDECMALMTNKRIRHLPVVNGGELVGGSCTTTFAAR